MKTEKIFTGDMMSGYSQLSEKDAAVPAPDPLDLAEDSGAGAAAVFEGDSEVDCYRQAELDKLWKMIADSNDKIQQAAEALKPFFPEPKSVPPVLGLTLDAAGGALGQAELRVGRVVQQYHNDVPAGCIISQVPAPGGSLNKKGCVHIVISKGPPPEREKHDVVRAKETVRGTGSLYEDEGVATVVSSLAQSIKGSLE